MKIKKILVLTFLTVASSMWGATRLTVEDCQKMANENYPLIVQYDLMEKFKEYADKEVRNSWLPQFIFNAQASYQSDAPDIPGDIRSSLPPTVSIDGISLDQYKVGLEINQTIWDGGYFKHQKAVNESKLLTDRKDLDVQLYKLNATVNDLFFGIILIDESLKINDHQIALLNQNLKYLSSHLQNGTITQSDYDAVYVQKLQSEQQTKQLKSMHSQYMATLKKFIGVDDSVELDLQKPNLENIDFVGAVNNRPELQLFEAQQSLLNSQRRAVNTSLTPKIGLFASGFYSNPGLNFVEDMMDNQWSWNYIVGVSLKWNIGAFYNRKSSLNKIKTQSNLIDTNRELFLFHNDIEQTQSNKEIDEIKQQIEDDNTIISLRKSIREAAESKLKNGVIDVNDLLTKITEERVSMLTKCKHDVDLMKAIYKLKYTNNN